MPRFTYKAVDQAGGIFTGEMDAPSSGAVADRLIELGHTPMNAVEVSGAASVQAVRRALGSGISQADIAYFTRQLASLLEANITLERGLDILSNLSDRKPLQRVVAELLDRVRGGASLSEALGAAGGVFPRYFVSIVSAGEMSGALDAVLARVADYMESALAIRERIISALIYPLLLLLMIVLTLFVLVGFVLPQFEPLFDEAGGSLPVATQIVLAVGGFVEAYWWVMVLAVALGAYGIHLLLQRPAIRLAFDKWLLRTRLLFHLVEKGQVAAFSRTLATLIGNGLSLPSALAATRETLTNTALRQSLGAVQERVQEGSRLSDPLQQTGMFPALAIQLMSVGEETGQLEPMLLRTAIIYERDVEQTLDRLLALLVPLMTIVMGALIAGLIASIMIGIMSVNQLAI